jgi:tRNA A-37 threonylcarbamoyl transferase component Bud32/membrane-associated phospholipid phosphatase
VTAPGEAAGAPTTEPGLLAEPPDGRAAGMAVAEPGGRRLRRARRRRRPTGAAPPLPRSLGTTGKLWAIALALMVAAIGILLVSAQAQRAVDVADAAVLRAIAVLRTPWLTTAARGVDRVATGWIFTALAVTVLVGMVAFRRWRHLFTFLAAIVVMQLVAIVLYQGFSRPRPYDVVTIGRWAGFSSPSPPVVALSAVLVAVIYAMTPAGRPRGRAKLVVAGVLAVVIGSRLYLAVDHPFDVVAGLVIGIAVPLAAFRLFTPNAYVPVTYRRGKTAHLDVTGRRGEAIIQAVRDQLGLSVIEARPVGLAGSGGSTPLRLRVESTTDTGKASDTYLFAKLFAMNHVRADRWYKLGRRILYGRLEDETRFESVRRLVEYEDYAFRLLRDAGVPTATPYGIVEITPEREYMLVTSFIDGAVEIGEAEVDDAVIDEALGIMRLLWDTGLAHRDIKPANIMIRDGRVFLIDAAFAQVRPSPWRQAVDLGNMMLVLATRSDAERVYDRALRLFTPDDIAEAFAATRGVASPSQLRAVVKQDGRDLLGQFRRLAPDRPHIALQRWSIGRVALALGVLVVLILGTVQAISMFTPAYDIPISGSPDCGTGSQTVLMAQAVPSATQVPCLAALPAGWELGGVDIERYDASFWLDSDQAGDRAVEATLQRPEDCGLDGAVPTPSDEVGTERLERPQQLSPALRNRRFYLFPGGCVTYEFDFDPGAGAALIFDVEEALGFVPRTVLIDAVQDRNGLALCGAGTECTD